MVFKFLLLPLSPFDIAGSSRGKEGYSKKERGFDYNYVVLRLSSDTMIEWMKTFP